MNRVSGPRLRVALTGVAALLLAACSSGSTPAPSQASSPSAAASSSASSAASASPSAAASGAAKSYRFAVVLPTISINILNDIYEGTKAKAAEIGNIEIVQTGQLDATAFLNDCMQIVATKPDALIYDSIDAVGHSPCIQEANKNGIKVVCLVACVSAGTNDATVTIDAKNDGKLMADWTIKTIGSGDVGFLEGAPGDEFGIAIGTGFKETITACSGCKLVADVPGGVDRNTAYTTSLTVMTGNPTMVALSGSNDDVGLGIVQAAQQQGVLDKMAIAGHGGSCNGLASILKGEMGFTVLIPGHTTGETAVDVAYKLLQGETVEKTTFIPALGVDQEMAQGILAGTTPNPPDLDVKSQLEAANTGCPS